MSPTSDLDEFYRLLAELEARIGGRRRLAKCRAKMGWPKRGVYFFFEPGEHRADDPASPRVVRVGSHALTVNSKTTLWKRIYQHRGTLAPYGGNHRGSIFRLIVGDALMRRNPEWAIPGWGNGNTAPRETREAEIPHEARVSDHLGKMTLLFVSVPDAPGPQNARGFIERNAIALLSGCRDKPSADWLGRHSSREPVRQSGLWNSNHVGEDCDPAFIARFAEFVGQAQDPSF